MNSVSIPSTAKYVGDYSFYGCTGLKQIKTYAIIPPEASYSAFGKIDLYSTKLLVRSGCTNAYLDQWSWNKETVEEFIAAYCETPLLTQEENGDFRISCATEGATYQYTISYSGITSSSDISIPKDNYTFEVYAIAPGFAESQKVTRTISVSGYDNDHPTIGDVTKMIERMLRGKE